MCQIQQRQLPDSAQHGAQLPWSPLGSVLLVGPPHLYLGFGLTLCVISVSTKHLLAWLGFWASFVSLQIKPVVHCDMNVPSRWQTFHCMSRQIKWVQFGGGGKRLRLPEPLKDSSLPALPSSSSSPLSPCHLVHFPGTFCSIPPCRCHVFSWEPWVSRSNAIAPPQFLGHVGAETCNLVFVFSFILQSSHCSCWMVIGNVELLFPAKLKKQTENSYDGFQSFWCLSEEGSFDPPWWTGSRGSRSGGCGGWVL